MTTTLTFTIPRESWLTSNRQTTNRGHRARIVRELQAVAILTARGADMQPIVGPVLADWEIRYPKGVRLDKGDPVNAAATTKPLLDGLVRAGLLEDDGPLHVVRESFQRGPNLTVPSLHEIHLVLTPQTVPF